MLTDLIEKKQRELRVQADHAPMKRDDSEWGKAKQQVTLLSTDFGSILDEAMQNRFEFLRLDKRNKDMGVTIPLASIMGNACVLQIIRTEKSNGDKARYILTEANGNRSFIRNLVS